MNKLNFIKADKPDCSNATDSGKITVTVREFITTTLAEKIATALWNKPEWADSIVRFNYDNKIKNDCFNVIALNETGDVVGSIAFKEGHQILPGRAAQHFRCVQELRQRKFQLYLRELR